MTGLYMITASVMKGLKMNPKLFYAFNGVITKLLSVFTIADQQENLFRTKQCTWNENPMKIN